MIFEGPKSKGLTVHSERRQNRRLFLLALTEPSLWIPIPARSVSKHRHREAGSRRPRTATAPTRMRKNQSRFFAFMGVNHAAGTKIVPVFSATGFVQGKDVGVVGGHG